MTGDRSFKPIAHGTHWVFGEDVPGRDKYGWIAHNKSSGGVLKQEEEKQSRDKETGNDNNVKHMIHRVRDRENGMLDKTLTDKQSEIIFRIKTRRNVLKVGVLKSYTRNMGTLACCVDCTVFKPTNKIITRWRHPVSMESLQLIKFTDILAPGPINQSTAAVRNRLLRCRVTRGQKVKLTSILSC